MKKNRTSIGLLVLTALAMAIVTGCMKEKTVAVFGPNGATLAQPLPTAAPDSVGLSAERLKNIDAFFASQIERKRVPGAVVAIARHIHQKQFQPLAADSGIF
jgi:hypothetical protein